MSSKVSTRPHRAALRWLAIIPAAIGLVFGFVALIWTEWPQLIVAIALLTISAATWRVFSGTWPFGTEHT